MREDPTVLILAPVGRDGSLLRDTLDREGIRAHVCDPQVDLEECLNEGAGALILTQEAMSASEDDLKRVLRRQPAWSDLPVILLVSPHVARKQAIMRDAAFTRSMTVLERPIRTATLVSVVRTALRARRRQREIRDLLRELKGLNATLEVRVEETTAQVRDLSAALTLAEQQERQRISELLHDHLQQLLFAARLHLHLIDADGLDEAAVSNISFVREMLAEATRLTRDLSVELHPPVLRDEGLTAAIEWTVAQMREQHNLTITVEAESDPLLPSREMMILITRSVRELLFNVVKHAGTACARVRIHATDTEVTVTVADDGEGYDPTEVESRSVVGSGLRGLRERLELLGGTLTAESMPGAGTRTTLRVPATLATD